MSHCLYWQVLYFLERTAVLMVSGGWFCGCRDGRGCKHRMRHCRSAVPAILVFQCSAPACTIHHRAAVYVGRAEPFSWLVSSLVLVYLGETSAFTVEKDFWRAVMHRTAHSMAKLGSFQNCSRCGQSTSLWSAYQKLIKLSTSSKRFQFIFMIAGTKMFGDSFSRLLEGKGENA